LNARAERAGITGHREYNNGWHTALDLANLLVVSQAITISALERKESRGGHFRTDYPEKDPAFAAFNIVVRRASDGAMQIARAPIADMPAELKKVIEENK
jgi:succinate dehydrogenase / fumarate reductase flavoprotein subunit